MALRRWEPSRQQIQSALQLWCWQEVSARADNYVVPKTVNVLRCGPCKRGCAIEIEPAPTAGAVMTCKKQPLLLQCHFVNLAGNPGANLGVQKQPVALALAVVQLDPERLAKA